MRIPEQIRDITKEAKRQGWTIEWTKGKQAHLVFISPAGRKVFFSGSPSDMRSHHRLMIKLRRHGFKRENRRGS
jgi:predicted RNA binding protein YcfA (HicA-like mRNA interferase family)